MYFIKLVERKDLLVSLKTKDQKNRRRNKTIKRQNIYKR